MLRQTEPSGTETRKNIWSQGAQKGKAFYEVWIQCMWWQKASLPREMQRPSFTMMNVNSCFVWHVMSLLMGFPACSKIQWGSDRKGGSVHEIVVSPPQCSMKQRVATGKSSREAELRGVVQEDGVSP